MIRSVGYDGSIDSLDWAAYLAPHLGSSPTVVNPNDFLVTRGNAGLSVSVAPGTAHGWGVTDENDSAITLNLPAASATRYDCIVIHRDWLGQGVTPGSGAPTGGKTTVEIKTSGPTPQIPTLDDSPGSSTMQALALVRVDPGATQVTEIIDLRATLSKAAAVRSKLAMTGPEGTRYALMTEGGRGYVRVLNPTSHTLETAPEWAPPPPPKIDFTQVKTGTYACNFNDYGVCNIYHPLNRRPTHVFFAARLTQSSSLIDLSLSTQPGSINEKFFTCNAKTTTDAGWAPYTGNITQVDWFAFG